MNRWHSLWPDTCLIATGLEIVFAHQTFAWGSDARGVAHVHVVIIGLIRPKLRIRTERRLFNYTETKLRMIPQEIHHVAAISPYLIDVGRPG